MSSFYKTIEERIRQARNRGPSIDLSEDNVKANKMAEAFKRMDGKSMLAVASEYDPSIPAMENENFIKSILDNIDQWQSELRTEMDEIQKGDQET